MKNELISVVMSTYNETRDYLVSSIESIVHQTYHPIEFIIVNDNPNRRELDELLSQYSLKYGFIKYIKNPKNMGLTASLNRGISQASGEYIARMDADDISLPMRLEKQYKFAKAHKYDLCGTWIQKIDEQGNIIDALRLPTDDSTIKKYLRWGDCLPHPTWLFNVDVFDKLGGYRDIKGAEDYDFILRAALYGFKIGNVDEMLLLYRIRSDSISESNNEEQQLMSNYLAKFYALKITPNLNDVYEYVYSKEYKIELDEIMRFQKSRNLIKNRQINIATLINLLVNKYFYIYFTQHLLKKWYSKV